MPRTDCLPVFNRRRDRLRLDLILISEVELDEQGIDIDRLWRLGAQLMYNGKLCAVQGLGTAGILIRELNKGGSL